MHINLKSRLNLKQMFNTCAKCKSKDIAVIDSRERADYIYRRRRCGKCKTAFTTREIREDNFEPPRKNVRKVQSENKLKSFIKHYLSSMDEKELKELLGDIRK